MFYAVQSFPPGFPVGNSHVYWRIINLTVALSLWEGSEITVCISGVEQNALVLEHTAFVPPDIAGTTANMFNSLVNDRFVYTQAAAQDASFFVRWKFSGAAAVDGVQQGFYDTDGRHINGFTLQSSDDDSSWTTVGSKSGLAFGSAHAYSSIYSFP